MGQLQGRHAEQRSGLAAGYRSDDEKGLRGGGDGEWKGGIGGLVGDVFVAGEEAQEGTTVEGGVVADGAAEHGIPGLQGIKDGALGRPGGDIEQELALDAGEGAEMGGEVDADLHDALRIVAGWGRVHGSVWTSTERTAGRSRTMGDQVSPASGEA